MAPKASVKTTATSTSTTTNPTSATATTSTTASAITTGGKTLAGSNKGNKAQATKEPPKKVGSGEKTDVKRKKPRKETYSSFLYKVLKQVLKTYWIFTYLLWFFVTAMIIIGIIYCDHYFSPLNFM